MVATPRTFLDIADFSVCTNGERKFATWHGSDGKPTDEFTFADLWNEAGLVAFHLRMRWGLKKGDRVILCYNFGLHFFASFLGCMRAGVVAVLVYPPHPPLRKSLSKMASVVNDCDAKLILCDHDIIRLRSADTINPFSDSRNLWPQLEYKSTTKLRKRTLFGLGHVDMNQDEVFSDTTIQPDDVAFLQYTSGSTGEPKGVVITHKSLVASIRLNLDGFDKAFVRRPGELVGLSWLPQYHDLGLIYAVITPFIGGYEMHMMSPLSFIRNPLLWIELISKYRVHWSIGPNFAYKLTARKFRELKACGVEDPIEGLDLSCLEHLANTSEPVHLDTKAIFEEAFCPYGLPRTWLSCGYGLAENVVAVCWIHDYVVSTPVEGRIDKFVAIGHRKNFAPKLEIKIVDPSTNKEVEDGESGEIWILGPSVASAYHGKPKETTDTFKGVLVGEKLYENCHFLRTGDLGFFEEDRLFICGRIKDLIIVNGTNYYPQDIEDATQAASSAVRPGCIAAFSKSEHEADGVLEVVFEVRRDQEGKVNSIIEDVRIGISKAIGLVPSRVVAIKQGTLPKTTSGKIRRRPTRERLYKGGLEVVSEWSVSSAKADADRLVTQVEQMDLNSIHEAGTLEEGLQSTLLLLPSQKLPASARQVVARIECDIDELEKCFCQLNLHRIPELVNAWQKVDKSTSALQEMCCEILTLVEQRLPPFVQFAHFLASQSSIDNGLFELDGMELLNSIVHTIFVLNWMTEMLAHDNGLAEKKFNDDVLAEEELATGLSKSLVPAQLLPFTMGKTEDVLIHRFETFGWLKIRTVQSMMQRMLQITKGQAQPSTDMGHGDFVTVNVLEATWVDYLSGRMDNVEAGAWLAERAEPVHIEVSADGFLQQHFEHPLWTDLYKTWNMAFVARTAESRWSIAALLLPSFLRAPSSHFAMYRVISLNAILQLMARNFLSSQLEPRFFTNKSALVLGFFNRQWVGRLGKDKDRDWMNPCSIEEEIPTYIEELFDIFQSLEDIKRAQRREVSVVSVVGGRRVGSKKSKVDCKSEQFESIMISFFGKTFHASATWDTIGLTSMMAVQLSIVLSEKFQISVSPYCFMDYETPEELFRNFILTKK